jgi:hypothetical protein
MYEKKISEKEKETQTVKKRYKGWNVCVCKKNTRQEETEKERQRGN